MSSKDSIKDRPVAESQSIVRGTTRTIGEIYCIEVREESMNVLVAGGSAVVLRTVGENLQNQMARGNVP